MEEGEEVTLAGFQRQRKVLENLDVRPNFYLLSAVTGIQEVGPEEAKM